MLITGLSDWRSGSACHPAQALPNRIRSRSRLMEALLGTVRSVPRGGEATLQPGPRVSEGTLNPCACLLLIKYRHRNMSGGSITEARSGFRGSVGPEAARLIHLRTQCARLPRPPNAARARTQTTQDRIWLPNACLIEPHFFFFFSFSFFFFVLEKKVSRHLLLNLHVRSAILSFA